MKGCRRLALAEQCAETIKNQSKETLQTSVTNMTGFFRP